MAYSGTIKNDVLSQKDLKLSDWDMIDALAGDDFITGGNTNMQGGEGNDTIVGTTAYSTATYFSSPAGIDANLETGMVMAVAAAGEAVVEGDAVPDRMK